MPRILSVLIKKFWRSKLRQLQKKIAFHRFHLVQKVVLYLNSVDLAIWIHATVTALLHYNTLYMGLLFKTTWKLQLLQNAAAWLLSGAKQSLHTSPILQSFHWLPISYWVQFKHLSCTKPFVAFDPHICRTTCFLMLCHYCFAHWRRAFSKCHSADRKGQ